MTNNPAGRYFGGSGETIGNGEYLLHDVIRASTAAPTLFSPKKIEISAWHEGGKRKAETGYFMDGALSPHNNPSLQMFLLASMKAHNLGGAPVAALKTDRANGKS
jgi:patatin-like phospholipase/acyl hydrolase